MTLRLSTLVVACAALLMLAQEATAQVRASSTVYLAARVGLTSYSGDLDADTDDTIFSNLTEGGLGFGAELGYQFNPYIALGVAYQYGMYPALDNSFGTPATTINSDDVAQEVQLRLRYLPFGGARFSPFLTLGGTVAVSTPGGETGYGPVVGLGFDLALTPRLSFFLEGTTSFVFPDEAVDGADPAASIPAGGILSPSGDDADFDMLAFVGGGLRFTFKSPLTKVSATIDGPTSLQVGQSGTFTAYVNENATQPVTYTWDFGDGQTATGMTATHTYSQPGTYTVTFTATGPGNTDVQTLLVTVTPPPAEPPALANCAATPNPAGVGEAVRFSATVTGTQPVSFTYDFGDGSTANTLRATHSYSTPGTYTVTLTASNEAGNDQCTVVVTVEDRFCSEISELNTVYFGYNMSTLTDEARTRLNENIEALRRCPELCVVINAYTDDVEGDKIRLSERRAAEVRGYYVQQGIDGSRLQARGLGEAPDANNKEDPGPGDRNARRAESVPTPCSTLGN